jgi:hypothetical protein
MARFSPGQSGNTAGRPKGAPDRRTKLRALLEPHADALVNKAVNLALAGDTAALRMCQDRIIPPLKAQSEPLAAGIPTTGTLSEQAEAIYQAAASGKITTDEAADLISVLSNRARIVEVDEIRNIVMQKLEIIRALRNDMTPLERERIENELEARRKYERRK